MFEVLKYIFVVTSVLIQLLFLCAVIFEKVDKKKPSGDGDEKGSSDS